MCKTPEAVWPSAVVCAAMWTLWNTWEISMHTIFKETHTHAQLRTEPDLSGEDLTQTTLSGNTLAIEVLLHLCSGLYYAATQGKEFTCM